MAESDVQDFLKDLEDDEDKENDEDKPADDGAMEAKTIEAGGIIKDDQGNIWRVPDGNVDDLNDLNQIPGIARIKKDPRFHYQTINVNEIDEYLTNGWVLVSRKEAGLPETQIQKEGYGSLLADYVHYMDAVYVKKPLVLVTRDRMILDQPAKDAMNDLSPSDEIKERLRDAEIPMRHTHSRSEEEISQQVLDDLVTKEI